MYWAGPSLAAESPWILDLSCGLQLRHASGASGVGPDEAGEELVEPLLRLRPPLHLNLEPL
jgi:hypothetical protein